MKTSLPVSRFARAVPARLGALALLLVATPFVRSAGPVPAVSEPKTHTLFMGADISVESDHALHRVRDVADGGFVIDGKAGADRIPMNQGAVNLRVDLALKLSALSAEVTGLKAERAYSLATDPHRKFSSQQSGDAGAAQSALVLGEVNAATRGVVLTQMAAAVVGNAPGSHGAQAVAQAQTNLGSATGDYNNALIAERSDLNFAGYQAGQLQDELTKQAFDAIDVSFAVRSERRMERPYVVVTAMYRARDDRPGVQRNWIYAQALPPIGPDAQPVRVRQGGFPAGYELQGYQVHLYDQGTEIATNVAPKRVPLTRDEAFQYVLMEYVSAHKEATLPAAAVMGRLPADLPERLARGEFDRTYFVRVGADGLAAGVFLDESCGASVTDDYLLGLVKNLRFKPALDRGKPVDGIARLRLAELKLST